MELVNSPLDEDFDPDSPGIFAKIKLSERCFRIGPSGRRTPITQFRLKLFGDPWRIYWNLTALCQLILTKYRAEEWPHHLPTDASELAKDAQYLLYRLRFMEGTARKKRIPIALAHAFEVGRAYERIKVRWADDLVAHERKRQHGLSQKSRAGKRKTIEAYRALRQKHPRMKKSQVVPKVAKELGVSQKTVWTHLSGIDP
jgi:hypothetical protein